MKNDQVRHERLKQEITDRIYMLFVAKFHGNKSKFALASGVNESSIRDLFNKGQGITLHTLFKLCHGLGTTPAELLKGLKWSTIHLETKKIIPNK